jgi:hypothetical protein
VLLGGLAPASGLAHSTFVRAYTFHLEEPGAVEAFVFNGVFEASVDSIPLDRVDRLILVSPSGQREIPREAWTRGEVGSFLWRVRQASAGLFGGFDERRTSTVILPLEEAGTHHFAFTQHPARLAMTPAGFAEFLAEVGLEEEPIAADAEGDPLRVFREWYVKTTQSYFQVGEVATDTVLRPLGLPLEILPRQNPVTRRAGDSLRIAVLFEGEPLADQVVLYGQGADRRRTRTDARGEAVLELDAAGDWWIDLARVVAAEPGSELTHRTYWATLTFSLP